MVRLPSAYRRVMNTESERPPASAPRLPFHFPVPWVYVLMYLVGVAMEWLVPFGLAQRRWIAYCGLGVFVLGAMIAGWGWLTFFKADTTTIPGRKSSELVTWGPYRHTRNPMYLGLAIAYLGEAGLLCQVWPVLFLPLVLAYVNWFVIPVEEARLSEVFGAKYGEYRNSVRRWL